VLSSLKYAVEHLGGSLKIVVVLGHSGCGAVSAAVDVFLEPAQYLPLATSHSLRGILDRLLVVVQASAKNLQDTFGPDIVRNPAYREALIEISIVINAALAAYTVQQEMESNNPGGLRAVYGVYLLDARQVWAPRRGTAIRTGLADPPNFVELVDDVPGRPTLVESVICCPPRRRWSAHSDDRPDIFEGPIVHLLAGYAALVAHPCSEMTNMRTAGFGAKLPFIKRGI
jgi:hypothetical protein